MSVGVAILGGGIFAREEHLPAVNASKDLTLKAVWSRSLKSAQTLIPDSSSKVELYSEDSAEANRNLSSLLSRSDVHAVIIALPILNQPTYVRQCLLAGKHVLSEKPVAENVHDAIDLIKWYRSERDSGSVNSTWAVAEQFRFMDVFSRAAEARSSLGRTLGFRLKVHFMIEKGSKYYETDWRKTPTHQGGFLLDGGVHFLAGLRQLLLPSDPLASLSAHTTQLQPHLAPVDTADASAKTVSGATGTVSISVGTTYKGTEVSVACESGVVEILDFRDGKVRVCGKEEVWENEGGERGVAREVRVWGERIVEVRGKEGEEDARQSPEEALADLELIEAMLKSGGGEVVLRYQEPRKDGGL